MNTRSNPNTRRPSRMSDEAVREQTGKSWPQWFAILDKAGMKGKPHKEIVAYLVARHGLGSWWQQMVTVEYERARGMRERHQTPSGYTVSISKTIRASVDDLFEAWHNRNTRRKWLGQAELTVRTATPARSMRITWEEGSATSVEVGFYPKEESKSQITVQHSKLADAKDVEHRRAFWSEALERLRTLVER